MRCRTSRPRVVAAVVALAVAIGACSSDESSARPERTEKQDESVAASAGCRAGTSVTPGVSDRTMTSRGVERQFQLTIPGSYDGTSPLPIVLGLHALSIPHTVTAGIVGFGDMAARYDFIAVAPSGRLDGPTPYWQAAATTTDNYDVVFISELLDLLEAELCVNRTRVYSTGMSNGGQMSSALACELPDRITAVGPVAGVEFPEQCAPGPVPVIAFHGSADPIVTYEGGGLNAEAIADAHHWKGNIPADVPEHRGVDDALSNWAEHNGCGDEPVEEQVSPEVRRRTWPGCEAETVLYIIDGGGHAWPGKPVPGFEDSFGHATTEIDATALTFEFFFDQPAR
jgi:polyhydroxybutyrate depolymerase